MDGPAAEETVVKFLILGAGELGYALTYDLIRSPKTEMVVVADRDKDKVQKLKDTLADEKIVPVELDCSNAEYVAELMNSATVSISCLPADLHYEMAKLALLAKANFCYVENDPCQEILEKIELLHEVAEEEGVAIIPALGLTPGLVSILAMSAADSMDDLYEIKVRLGVLPQEKDDSMAQFLSPSFKTSYYKGSSRLIRDGKPLDLPALTEAEDIDLPSPIGSVQAFLTGRSLESLAQAYNKRVSYLDFKSIHYPGQLEKLTLLRDLGLLDTEKLDLDSQTPTSVVPEEVLKKLLEKVEVADTADLVVIRIIVTGLNEEKPIQHIFECIDYGDQADKISAYSKMTAFPASIIAQLIAREDIKEKGVLKQEQVVPARLFLAELDSRGILLTMTERAPAMKD